MACASPAQLIELQRGVDMASLVERLDDWSAVRLGALGPLRAGADVLNHKRAAFLVTATREYGVTRAELFALFVLHSAFTDDLHQVLLLLARDKQLGETLGRMDAVREALRQRGLNLADYPDRPERLGDVARGLASAANDALSSSELSRGALAMKYSVQRGQLPEPYQRALDEVERAELERAFSPGSVALGCFDALTLGVPVGYYNLVAGTCHGAYSLLWQGHYEQGTRELTAAAVLVALYAGGKALRYASEGPGSTGTAWVRAGRLAVPELGFPGLAEVADRLLERLGGEGVRELARYIQAHREAALLVYEGGEAGAVALHEARGDVAKAQAWLSEAKSERVGPTWTRARAGTRLGGMAALVDEAAGLTPEVVETKLLAVELESTGPRLSGNVAMLEKQRPLLDAPPLEAQGHPLWSEYVAYWEKRLAELKQGTARPPLAWAGYEQMRGLFSRGLAFERLMVSLLRADAELPRAQRRFLQDFNEPQIETYVGVAKPGTPGVRFADVLVIEKQPSTGQLPRVETFSFKSRNLSALKANPLAAQMIADASEALRYYGEALDIRRRTLGLRDTRVRVQRVRLIYEGGELEPKAADMGEAVEKAQNKAEGVEVLFQ